MPRVVFSDDVESKLIELWADMQRNPGGLMKKRKVKEREISEKLNEYLRELHGDDVEPLTPLVVKNKIDNLKAKAKEFYRKFTAATSTGSSGDAAAGLDLDSAARAWANFRTWNRVLGDVPGYGPVKSLSSAAVLPPQERLLTPHQASSATAARTPVSTSSSSSSSPSPSLAKSTPTAGAVSHVEDEDVNPLVGTTTPVRRPPPASSPSRFAAATTRPPLAGCDSDDDMLDDQLYGPRTDSYQPGSHPRKRIPAAEEELEVSGGLDSDVEVCENEPETVEPPKKRKKPKRRVDNNPPNHHKSRLLMCLRTPSPARSASCRPTTSSLCLRSSKNSKPTPKCLRKHWHNLRWSSLPNFVINSSRDVLSLHIRFLSSLSYTVVTDKSSTM